MSALRILIDNAITEVVNEHPKYFTPRGKEHIRATVLRKVMAAFRDATKENESGESRDESATQVIRDEGLFVDPESREGRAYATLCKAGGAVSPLTIGGKYRIPACAAIRAVWAFADAPTYAHWLAIRDKSKMAAWLRFYSEVLAGVARSPIIVEVGFDRHLVAPWPWPPLKDGSLSHQDPEPVDEAIDEGV